MKTMVLHVVLTLLAATTVGAQEPPVFPGDVSDAYPQPSTWVPVEATVKLNGLAAGNSIEPPTGRPASTGQHPMPRG